LDHGEAGSYLFVRRISTENALVLTDPINSRTVNSEAPRTAIWETGPPRGEVHFVDSWS